MTSIITIALVTAVSTFLVICSGYNITTCGGNQKVQVEEGGDAVFTCTGITHAGMGWTLTDKNGTGLSIAACPSSGPCSVTDDYSVSRPQRDTSVLNVTGNYRRRIAGTVGCAGLEGGKPVESASCDVRVVYTSYSVNCTPSVNKTDWTVDAACDVNKIYASDGNYNCQWRTSPSGLLASFPGQITTTPFTDSTGQQYRRMTCSFTGQPLPTEDGQHVYLLTIDPRNNSTETHSVVLHIKSPRSPPVLLNCPSVIVEGDDVSCTCQASASVPSALVSWTGKAANSTSTLQLNNVSQSLEGQRFTCRQYWGGFDTGHVKETSYTVNVKYSPPSVVVSGVTNYTAGDFLNLTCSVTGGNAPMTSVTFHCGDHGAGADVTSAHGGQTAVTRMALLSSLSAEDDGTVCLCTIVGTDRVRLYSATSTVIITVQAPPNNDGDENSEGKLAAIVGGVASVIIIALVLVIIILMCKRRCDPLYTKPVSRGQEAEHTYTELDHRQQMNPTAQRPTSPRAADTQNVSEGHYEITDTVQQPEMSDGHYENSAESKHASSDGQYGNIPKKKQQASTENNYENTKAN